MTNANSFLMVRNSSLATELDDEQCKQLAQYVTPRSLADGEILMREGEVDNHLYAVVSGSLAVTRETGSGDWIALHLLRAKDLAGEMGFLDGLEHSATLRAVGSTEIFSLKRDRLESLLELHPKLVYLVMRAIVREVHSILRRMNIQHVEFSNYISKQHGRY